ncbi:hypothetical protein [Stieleria varia]|uniref:Lipoprotein n=1 Tax=Stieleria varia TaxID=2528005 RepID=A0A5C6B6S6_9BACT|nr:hypothetical protein [Stieleria varia]TWU07580.1 hypothetical protein Pla52n_01530 [Stieleria varia]
MRFVSLLLAPMIVLGCASVGSPKFKVNTRDEMHVSINDAIPIGTPLARAREIMESAGFECELILSGSFTEDMGLIGDDGDYPAVANARYLQCKRANSTGLLTANFWTIAIVLDDGDKVSEVLVRVWGEGP